MAAMRREELDRLEEQADQAYFAIHGMLPERQLDKVKMIVHLEVYVANGTSMSRDNNATSCGIRIPAEACPTLQLLCDKAFQYYPPLYELYGRKSWEEAKQIVRWKMDETNDYLRADDELYKKAFDYGVRRSRLKNIDIWISALISN